MSGMTSNHIQERSGIQGGRAVLVMDGVLGGAELASVAGRSVRR